MKNEIRDRCYEKALPVPEATKAGDPLIIGKVPCVAVTDYRAADGTATVRIQSGSYGFNVTGKKKAGAEQEIAVGEPVYLKSGELNANNEEGTLFGYAMQKVVKNKTEFIEVMLATP